MRLQTEWLEGALADLKEAGGRAPSSALVLEQQRVAQVGSLVGEGRSAGPDCIPSTWKGTASLLEQ